MKLCCAFRRGTFYPFVAGAAWNIPEDPRTRTKYLGKVSDIGFDGIELGFEAFGGFKATSQRAKEFQSVLADAGTPCVAIRAGGGLCQPNGAAQNRKRLEKAVEIAEGVVWAGRIGSAFAEMRASTFTPPPNQGRVAGCSTRWVALTTGPSAR